MFFKRLLPKTCVIVSSTASFLWMVSASSVVFGEEREKIEQIVVKTTEFEDSSPVSTPASGGAVERTNNKESAAEEGEEDLDSMVESMSLISVSEAGGGNEGRDSEVPASVGSRFGEVARSIYQSMNPDIAMILDVAVSGFVGGDALMVGAHDPRDNGFNIQQLELSMGASIDPYFRFDTNIVFSLFGVEIEEAYATTLDLPWNLQVRAGQFLTKFGRLNNTHPHSWHFINQPIVNGKFFGGEGNRGLGVELSWLAPLPWYVHFIGASTMPSGECCSRSYEGGEASKIKGPQNLVYTGRIEQFFNLTDDLGLLWGISGQTGESGIGKSNRANIYGTDFYLRWKPANSTTRTSVDLTLEGMVRTRQIPHNLLVDYGTREEMVWRINPEWEVGARHEYVSGIAKSAKNPIGDPLDPEWTSGRNRYAIQGTLYPTHFSRLRLQGEYDAPSYKENGIWGVMLSLEVVAGAHGAHDY